MRWVLLNGEGMYCWDFPDPIKGNKIPAGCFTMYVTPDEYEKLKSERYRMLADRSMYLV